MNEPLSAPELDALIEKTINDVQADIAAYEERVALQAPDDGLTTDRRAIEALKRKERFAGEHQVAKAWLLNSRTARIWGRNGVG